MIIKLNVISWTNPDLVARVRRLWFKRDMGIYRLILALCVLYSHAFGAVFGKNIGVVAVISFFVMSGYVMALLVRKYYPELIDIPSFYADRAFRIFPHYLFYVFAVMALASQWGVVGLSEVAPWQVASNLVIVPLNLYTLFPEAIYDPPSWSLGLELTFYLAFPFVVLAGRRWQHVIFTASVAVAVMAFLGMLDSNYGGYRLLPGTLIFFLSGAALATPERIDPRYPVIVIGLAALGLAATLGSDRLYAMPYDFEVTVGALIGITAVATLRKLPAVNVDRIAGDLSYGLFLSHFPMIFVADTFGLERWPFVPVAAMMSAIISYTLIERPVLALRHRFRQGAHRRPNASWRENQVRIAADGREHG
ncbi:acyltransferase [Mesorhizobium sp.]|uniref:acyltransferase family protein n=1 Tax=Mesorhizobium sp. TaxID=1871066 RepID=UPI000FE7995D|nr:acyltransferase [Mesorhizobium sp.]RWF33728.1 MAG: acyltransferase [Mesorhizobium sp.]